MGDPPCLFGFNSDGVAKRLKGLVPVIPANPGSGPRHDSGFAEVTTKAAFYEFVNTKLLKDVDFFSVGEAFSLDRRGWKAAPTNKKAAAQVLSENDEKNKVHGSPSPAWMGLGEGEHIIRINLIAAAFSDRAASSPHAHAKTGGEEDAEGHDADHPEVFGFHRSNSPFP